MADAFSHKHKGKKESLTKPSKKRLRAATVTNSYPDLFEPSPAPDTFKSSYGETATTIPKSWVKFVIALFLLPLALILTGAFIGTLKNEMGGGLLVNVEQLPNQISMLMKQPCGWLLAGMLFFFMLFLSTPRSALMIPYVFGHEVTHALWVKLFGGHVANRFHVSLEGGHVLTDRVNTWIILSPYFFPIYAILAGTLYGILLLAAFLLDLFNPWHEHNPNLCHSIIQLQWIFVIVIGFTLAFHFTFTFLLVSKSQPDLHYGGTFFSLMVIYLINLLMVTGLLIAISPSHGNGYLGHLDESLSLFIRSFVQLWHWSVQGLHVLRMTFGK